MLMPGVSRYHLSNSAGPAVCGAATGGADTGLPSEPSVSSTSPGYEKSESLGGSKSGWVDGVKSRSTSGKPVQSSDPPSPSSCQIEPSTPLSSSSAPSSPGAVGPHAA